MKTFRSRVLAVFAGLLIGTASIALAATFTKFTPATGILKGSATTYVTTAASSADLLGVIGTVPVANGGTNLTASADDAVMIGNGTTWQSKTVPDCTDTGGNHLNYTQSTNTISCGTSAGSTGTFTATLGGMSTTVTATCRYSVINNWAFVYCPGTLTGTSNAAGLTKTITGIPAAITPVRSSSMYLPIEDNGADSWGSLVTQTNSTWTLGRTTTAGALQSVAWTASGTAGVDQPFSIQYILN